jgi:hypothetical protein
MSQTATSPNLTRREQSRLRKQRQRDRQRALAAAAKQAQKERDEVRDEEQAPAVLRHPVVAPDGSVIRAPRLVRDSVGFRHADPLTHIAVEVLGGSKQFTAEQYRAAKQLRDAWDSAGEGVNLGASDWGSIRGPRGTAPMTPAGHSDLVKQVEQRLEIEAAATFLGSLWTAVRDMMLMGMSVAAWAAKSGKAPDVAKGYLMAALDRLVEFYSAKQERPVVTRIRTLAPGRDAYSVEVEDGGK